jgi:hypothetical protein
MEDVHSSSEPHARLICAYLREEVREEAQATLGATGSAAAQSELAEPAAQRLAMDDPEGTKAA